MNGIAYELYLNKAISKKVGGGQVHWPVVPATQGAGRAGGGSAEVGGSLEARSLRPAWATQQDPVSLK